MQIGSASRVRPDAEIRTRAPHTLPDDDDVLLRAVAITGAMLTKLVPRLGVEEK